MASSHFCFSSNTYKNQVFEGFSRLQQCDEFVDMTLATGDHLVKVHKTLVALASPFLKALLQTIPCQHPVLFLTNVSYEDLNFILEYIYTGEVKIPSENIETFLNAARAMHISGLENIVLPKANTDNKPRKEKKESHVNAEPLNGGKRFPAVKASIIIKENDFNLQVEPNIEIRSTPDDNGKKIGPVSTNVKESEENANLFNLEDFKIGTSNNNIILNVGKDIANENINLDAVNNTAITDNPLAFTSENIANMPMIIDDMPQLTARPFISIGKKEIVITNTACDNRGTDVPVDSFNINNRTSFANLFNIVSKLPSTEEKDTGNISTSDLGCGEIATQNTGKGVTGSNNQGQTNGAEGGKDSILYTISKRGSLQLIMNRFMYYSHYTRDGGRKRRWRCIDYRDSRCLASIDAEGDEIVARKHEHCHPNHDSKIWNKVVKSRVFSSLKMAQDNIKEKHTLPKPEEVVLSD